LLFFCHTILIAASTIELGYEYVHLFLEEQDEPAPLDVLLSEIDYSHLVWEIRRGNVLLIEAYKNYLKILVTILC